MYNGRAPLLNSACVPSICFDVPEGTGRVLVHWLGRLGTTKTCEIGVPAYMKGILPTGAGDEDAFLYITKHVRIALECVFMWVWIKEEKYTTGRAPC